MSTIETGQTGCSNIADSLVGIGIELQTFLDTKQTFIADFRTATYGTESPMRIYSLISAFGTKLTDGATCVIVGPSSLLSLD